MTDFENNTPVPEELPEGGGTPEETSAPVEGEGTSPSPSEASGAVTEGNEAAEAIDEATSASEDSAETAAATAEENGEASASEAQTQPVSHEPPQTLYRWSYADEAAHGKSGRGKGVIVYAAVMTAVFLLSFGLLLAVLLLQEPNTDIIRPGVNDLYAEDEAVTGVELAKRAVVVIEVKTQNGKGTATGIVMTSDGYIATNHHAIDNATKIKVTFYDGTVLYAEVIGSSAMDDLAVIKVNATGLHTATFAYSENCYVGQTVYAIGTPASSEFAWTTTRGIISYKDREVKIYDDDGTLQKKLRLLQTDANVNPGNSGGPLINAKGEVVGVVSMKLAEGYEGIGFAIPSDGAVEILEAIITYGNADSINSSLSHKRPMLGITGVYLKKETYYLPNESGVEEIPAESVDQYDRSELIYSSVSGIYVMGFAEGMNAATKLQVGDMITAVQGEEFETMYQMMEIINDYYAGDTVTLTVYRDGRYIPVDIVLSPRNDS